MTTIAFDGTYLCADSLVTAGGVRMGFAEKIAVTRNGVVACAGDMAVCYRVLNWVAAGASKKNIPDFGPDDHFTAIWIDRKKRAWHIDTALIPFPACVPCSEGSGADFALAAMVSGMSARKAVALAIKMDCFSGGEIQEVEV